MGIDAHAVALIGLTIGKRDVLYQPKRKVKLFDHNHPENWIVDPESGKALWKEVRDPIPGYEEGYPSTLCGYSIHLTRHSQAFVALRATETESHRSGSLASMGSLPANIEEEKKKMKDVLEPLGLWDERSFGLWAIQLIN